MNNQLRKSRSNRVFSGVLGGFAETYGMDTALIRIIYTAITIFTGFFPGLFIYIVAAVVMPED